VLARETEPRGAVSGGQGNAGFHLGAVGGAVLGIAFDAGPVQRLWR